MTDKSLNMRGFAGVDAQSAELAAMRRMLAASRGTFSISVAICNSPALRDHLIQQLTAETPDIVVLAVPEDTEDVYDFARAKVSDSPVGGLFVTNMEKLLPSAQEHYPVLRRLNAARELWGQVYHCPVVFWLPEYAATLLSVHARDLWSWKSHQFEFVSEMATATAGAMDQYAGVLALAANLDADQKRFRIAELEQRLAEAGDPPKAELAGHVAVWLGELGFLYFSLGQADAAERMLHRSLAIFEKFGRLESMAGDYSNLGIIYWTCGYLDRAEEMHRKALAIDERFGRPEGLARDYGNLGLIYQTHGDLGKAEEMYNKALAIYEKFGPLDKAATGYGNLGIIHQMRGDIVQAEEMCRKALAIFEKLGRLDGMANQYGNLGVIYQKRSDLVMAEEMFRKALAIDEKLGRLEGMAGAHSNLGGVHLVRGDLAEAEKALHKALLIDKQLGRLEGMATDYGNLGLVYQALGDQARAREFWTKARDLFAQIGIPQQTARVQDDLDSLPSSLGGSHDASGSPPNGT
jgi:tetratricopeptide (TPR) repeat protein